MIKITKRQSDIVHFLSENDVFITIKTLAERFEVSSRTLRYDLDELEYFFKDLDVKLERKPHFGVRVQFKQDVKSTILEKIMRFDAYQIPPEERRRRVLFYLLCATRITIDQLAERLEVSKQTIQSDLEILDQEITQTHLEISRKVRFGCAVEGDEQVLRRTFAQLYARMTEVERVIIDKYIEEKSETIATQAERIVQNMESFQKFNFAQPHALRSIIAFNLLRSSLGKMLPCNDRLPTDTGRFALVEKLINNLSLNVNTQDAMFILEYMLEAKVDATPQTWIEQDEDEIIAKELAAYLLNELTLVTRLNAEEALTFIENLQLHLKITLFRIRNNLHVENQILDRVKVSIPLIYEYTKARLIEYEKKSGLYFNEEEIAYIAMHVGAIVEKRQLYAPGLNVLVVCHFGIATSKIMVSRLAAMIPEINIIGTATLDEVEASIRNHTIDLIISTQKLNTNIDAIQVNPLLSDEDVFRIKTKVYKNTYLKQCTHFIKNFNAKSSETYLLSDFIIEKRIQIHAVLPEWRTAIRIAAQPLVDDRLIEKRYVDRMIRAVEEFGNYMVILPETAFVHAGIDDGVNEPCASLLVLRTPTVFGNQHQEMIRNIVVIAVKQREDDIIFKLAKILENPENRKKLNHDAITVKQILELKHEVESC